MALPVVWSLREHRGMPTEHPPFLAQPSTGQRGGASTRGLVGVSLILLLASACGGAIAEDAAEEIPEPLITQTLRTLQEPDTRELMAEVAGLPVIEHATERFAARIADGALDALSEEERAERIGEAVEGFVTEVASAITDTVGQQIAPALSRSVAVGLERALVRLTSEESRENLAQLAAVLGRAGAEQLAYGVHEALRDPEVQRTLGLTARNIGYEVAMGAGEAIQDIEAREMESRGASNAASEPAQASTATEREEGTPWAVVAAVVLAALLLAVFLVSRLQIRRRERSLLALANAIKDMEGRAWEGELRRTLSRRFRDDPDADYLRHLLRRHPELRVGGREDEPPRRFEHAEAT